MSTNIGNILIAIGATALGIAILRTLGQMAAGHAVAYWRERRNHHRNRHGRRPRQ